MIKFTKLLLLALVFTQANAGDEIVYMELGLENNSYGIETICEYGKFYQLNFRLKKNIIQNYNAYGAYLNEELLAIETGSRTIKYKIAQARSKSEIEISFNEHEFRKLFDAKSASIYIGPYLFNKDLIIETYKTRKSSTVEELNRLRTDPYYRLSQGLGLESNAYSYVKPRISITLNSNHLESWIKQCNNERNEHIAKANRDKKQKVLKQREAFEMALPKAQKGDAESQFLVARAYTKGVGTLKDYKKANTWLMKAAKQEYAAAQTTLGYVYATGELGVLKDMDKAKFWLKKAHQNGDPNAEEYWDKFELWKY